MDNISTGLPSDYVSLVSFFIRDEDEETALLRPGDTLFIYCRTGVVSVSDNGIVHSLTPGWFLLSHPRGSVQLRMSGIHSECCVLEIASGRTGIASCSASIFNFQAFDTLTRLDTEENRILLTLNEIANEISSHNEAEKRIMDLLFNVFLVKLERAVQSHGRATGFRYVSEAKQFIRENLSGSITVQTLADHLGIHRSYLMSIFRQQTHMSVKKYINRMRITQATILLTNSDLSVTEIAFQVGYNSRQNFYVAFEKTFGCSPSQFRVSQVADGRWRTE
ncbi:MAG: helix-turn-helix transcriptional regulator [Clostridia bacterium]|jgi:AraC-like DNA-binding protein|nr:helix-turn-helix transcriptional regulator [Clostridia bacterium]